MHEHDVVIIGAGVVGSAIARSLALKDSRLRIAVLEKEAHPAMHTSGRNSGVIHSGFNPKPGTLKAKLCVDGNRRLKEFCRSKNIPYSDVGTFVVARAQHEIPVLEELLQRGNANGVPGLRIIDAAELKRHEPEAVGVAALHSPSGGITSGKNVTNALADDAALRKVSFYFNERVTQIQPVNQRIVIETETDQFSCRYVINCAGLYADRVAHMMGVGLRYSIVPFRGEYFKIRPERSSIIKSMVYPIPNLEYPFLGVHWTKTIDGDVIIGPNATIAFGRESYSTFDVSFGDSMRTLFSKNTWGMFASKDFRSVAVGQFLISLSKKKFVDEARTLVPNVTEDDFITGKNGNRAQLVNDDGKLVDDILIEKTPNSLHILNAVSPGFTCSIAFAEHVVNQIEI